MSIIQKYKRLIEKSNRLKSKQGELIKYLSDLTYARKINKDTKSNFHNISYTPNGCERTMITTLDFKVVCDTISKDIERQTALISSTIGSLKKIKSKIKENNSELCNLTNR